MIPELVSGVQFEKGPYFADQGDFATAGSATITYASTLDASIAQFTGGQDGFARALVAASPALGAGHLLVAADIGHNDGPWLRPDAYRKFNGVIRYSGGNAANGFVVTGMGYKRAVELDRSGSAAGDCGGPTRPLRYGRHHRRWRHLSLQRQCRMAARPCECRHQSRRIRHWVQPQSVFQLHLLPRRPGQRRSVPSGRSPLRVGRPHQPGVSVTSPGAMRRTRSAYRYAMTIGNVGLTHTRRACCSRRCVKMPCQRPVPPSTHRTKRRGRRGCAR